MTTNEKSTEVVTCSKSINVEDTTFADLDKARKKVGAPTDARVNTGGAQYATPPENGVYLPASVTFTWTEAV